MQNVVVGRGRGREAFELSCMQGLSNCNYNCTALSVTVCLTVRPSVCRSPSPSFTPSGRRLIQPSLIYLEIDTCAYFVRCTFCMLQRSSMSLTTFWPIANKPRHLLALARLSTGLALPVAPAAKDYL